MKTITKTGYSTVPISTFESNVGDKFIHGLYLNGYDGSGSMNYEYLLNGNYKKFEAFLAPEKIWSERDKNNNIGQIKIYADEKLVYSSGDVASDITKPIKIDIDLTGALKVRIEGDSGQGFGFLDAKFIQ